MTILRHMRNRYCARRLIDVFRTDVALRRACYEELFSAATEAELAGLTDLLCPNRPVAHLLAHAINELWNQDSCDPGECGPCTAILALRPITAKLLAQYGPGHEWWNEVAGDVDWTALEARWSAGRGRW